MVLVAARLLNEGLTLLQGLGAEDWDAHEEGMGRVWIALPMMLTGAANISKALWGQGGRATTARQVLRQSLDVQDTSPLRDVSVRNHLEHFDERLDRWYAKSAHRNYLDRMVGPLSTIQGFAQSVMFRVFDHTYDWAARQTDVSALWESQRALRESQRALRSHGAACPPHARSRPSTQLRGQLERSAAKDRRGHRKHTPMDDLRPRHRTGGGANPERSRH